MSSRRRVDTLSDLWRQDEGIGLILVIGISAMMAILLAVITATAIRSLDSSREHVTFEQSLAAAEAGVDEELSNIQTARNQVPSVNYETPTTCRPAAPASSVFATEATEKAWAQAAIEALPASCTQIERRRVSTSPSRCPGGRSSTPWAGRRPATTPMPRSGCSRWSTSSPRTAPARRSSPAATSTSPAAAAVNAVSGLPADVHTNSNVTGVNNSLNVSGSITATGSVANCPSGVAGGCQAGQPQERVPVANPRAVYTDSPTKPPSGTTSAHRRHGAFPVQRSLHRYQHLCCALPQLVLDGRNASGPGTWTLQNTGTSYPGSYYVYGANAEVGANGNSRHDPDGLGARGGRHLRRRSVPQRFLRLRHVQQVRRRHRVEALRHPELPSWGPLHRPGLALRKRQLHRAGRTHAGRRQDRPADVECDGEGFGHRQQHLRSGRGRTRSRV